MKHLKPYMSPGLWTVRGGGTGGSSTVPGRQQGWREPEHSTEVLKPPVSDWSAGTLCSGSATSNWSSLQGTFATKLSNVIARLWRQLSDLSYVYIIVTYYTYWHTIYTIYYICTVYIYINYKFCTFIVKYNFIIFWPAKSVCLHHIFTV